MIYEKVIINGNEGKYAKYNFNKRYNIIKVIFDKNEKEDLKLLREIYKKSYELAKHVCTNAANNSNIPRNRNIVLANAISGTLSEYSWKEYINYVANREIVNFTEYIDPHEQIDLKVKNSNAKIEVRSSFVNNGIQFALCNKRYIFDILGPYKNQYKPNETFKDFYVRVLYPMRVEKFLKYFINSKKIDVYLTCGATLEMMENPELFAYKNLIPEGDLIEIESEYRIIPFNKSLDTLQILNLILESSKITHESIS